MGPGALSDILDTLPKISDERLLVGFDSSDDACVYKMSDELALVQTVDFFPPMIGDPYHFGRIAAANALSDVYAMGAKPMLAMNLLCLPDSMEKQATADMLRGGAEQAIAAGCIIAGGHTITDTEPKYGLCVTGTVHPDKVWTNRGAKIGDALVLTKPLGSGIAATGMRKGLLQQQEGEQLIECMALLNKDAAQFAAQFDVHACTDVTGFGLAGHATEMAACDGITLHFFADKLPLLPKVEQLSAQGHRTGGGKRNRQYLGENLHIEDGLPEWVEHVVCDPQTSGGLLIALPKDQAERYCELMSEKKQTAVIVGQIDAHSGCAVKITT